MHRAFCAVALFLLQVCYLSAQTPGAAQPTSSGNPGHLEFEVAAIKPYDPNNPGGQGIQIAPSGRLIMTGVDLKSLIVAAFNLSYWQIEGGDAWIEKDHYRIEAKAPEDSRPPEFNLRHSYYAIADPRLRQMLQSLLIQRFQLRFHRETKTGTIYLLELSGKPLKLEPVKAKQASSGNDSLTFGNIGWAEGWGLMDLTMSELANFAANYYLHCPVVDRTSLVGAFNYRSPHEDPDPQLGEPPGSFKNMIQSVGLKLSPSKGPIEYFVIDHAEKPSPN
jgi:uncharacterized protein (TIGR03435 family)